MTERTHRCCGNVEGGFGSEGFKCKIDAVNPWRKRGWDEPCRFSDEERRRAEAEISVRDCCVSGESSKDDCAKEGGGLGRSKKVGRRTNGAKQKTVRRNKGSTDGHGNCNRGGNRKMNNTEADKKEEQACPHGKRFGVDWSYKGCRGCRNWYNCGIKATRSK